MNEDTKKRYVQLAENFYKTKIVGDVTPGKIIKSLEDSAIQYRPDYFRRLRNALAYDQSEKGYSKAAKKINETVNPVTVKGSDLTKKSKERRVKSVSLDDLMALKSGAIEKGDKPLLAALELSDVLGCRPVELFNLKIVEGMIFIEGAKKTKKGDRGLDRLVKVKYIRSMKDAITVLQDFKESTKDFKSEPHKLIQARLALVAKKRWPRRKATPSLYSFRHQVGSNLKASGMDRLEIAYMMGHQATKSVDVYGDRRSGSGGVDMEVGVSAEQIRAVVRENHTTAPVKMVVQEVGMFIN
jgi:hypothetical protein